MIIILIILIFIAWFLCGKQRVEEDTEKVRQEFAEQNIEMCEPPNSTVVTLTLIALTIIVVITIMTIAGAIIPYAVR